MNRYYDTLTREHDSLPRSQMLPANYEELRDAKTGVVRAVPRKTAKVHIESTIEIPPSVPAETSLTPANEKDIFQMNDLHAASSNTLEIEEKAETDELGDLNALKNAVWQRLESLNRSRNVVFE